MEKLKAPKISKLIRLIQRIFINKEFADKPFEIQTKVIIASATTYISMISLSIFTFINLSRNNFMIGMLTLLLLCIVIFCYIHHRLTKSFFLIDNLNFSSTLVFFIYLFISGGASETGYMWYYVYPLVVFTAIHRHKALFFSLSLILITAIIVYTPLKNLFNIHYNQEILVRFFSTYLMVTTMTYFFEYSRATIEKKMIMKNDELQKTIKLLEQREMQIKEMAMKDSLTGLYNRYAINSFLSKSIEMIYRNNQKMAVFFIDLDRFKNINDTMGHDIGDEILKIISSRINKILRASDYFARIGGDEFIIITPDIKKAVYASVIARRIIETIRQPIILEQNEYHLTASIGISLYEPDSFSEKAKSEDLLKFADIAMFKSKEGGKNTFTFYQDYMDNAINKRILLEKELRKALNNNEFTLHYQPILDLARNEICGMEALIRWIHPEKGIISPADFIPIAEETGIIESLGIWIADTSLKQTKIWEEKYKKQLKISINLSPIQFKNRRFLDFLKEKIIELDFEPQNIECEFTEGILIEDNLHIRSLLKEFNDLGVKLSVDDFGTGYSSLSYLKRFSMDVLKIDKSFINQITDDAEYASIVKAIINMAKTLRLTIIAEGVETEEQLLLLKEMECDEIQGYYYSPPLPPDKFESQCLVNKSEKK
ncbi:MAG: EAL domain-containing protein [Spirochaetales bacterium]|nr:EAL domain-containing protein [Spirochaetales bacterium]